MDMSEMERDPDWPWPRLSSTRVGFVEDLHDMDMSEIEGDPDWPWPLLSSTRVDYQRGGPSQHGHIGDGG